MAIFRQSSSDEIYMPRALREIEDLRQRVSELEMEERSRQAKVHLFDSPLFLDPPPAGKQVVKAYSRAENKFFYLYYPDESPQPEAITTKTKNKDTKK